MSSHVVSCRVPSVSGLICVARRGDITAEPLQTHHAGLVTATTRTTATRVVLSTATALCVASVCVAVLARRVATEGRAFVLGSLGGQTLIVLAVLVAGVALVVLVLAVAWWLTRRSGFWPQVLVRSAASLLAVVIGLGLCVVAWLGALGSVRYVDVGTVDGRTVMVAEYRSLAGLGASLGYRDGWLFTPDPAASGPAIGDDGAGDPQAEFGMYRLEVAAGQVTVRFGDDGQNVLTAPRP